MAKGATAKVNVENIIKKAFGEDYVGTQDKKLYVLADDGGEKVQISISLTCPKVPLGDVPEADFSESAAAPVSANFEPAAITEEETQKLEDLLKKFNL